jgi:hypothetical protein
MASVQALVRAHNVASEVEVRFEGFFAYGTLHVRRVMNEFHVLAQI